ncbi:MAG: outer membrane lipoprotein-sorting protein [Bdellovibrio sp.]|nr:outer membrane lipoprotein-sorting protein [Bdellovibrio sp.]
MKHFIFSILFSVPVALLSATLTFANISVAQTGNEMVSKSDSMRFIEDPLSFSVEVQDIKGSSTQKTKYKVFTKGKKLSRVETIFPERQAGRKMLMKDDDLWLFTPDIKRPTRVSMQQRLTGEVANGDIVRTNFADDYDAIIKGEEKVEGQDTVHLYLKQKRPEVTYPAIDFWVSKKEYAPVRADFKTAGGKSLKVAVYTDPKMFFGHKIYTKIEITNALNKTQKSILNFSGYKKESLDESFFNKESLNN